MFTTRLKEHGGHGGAGREETLARTQPPDYPLHVLDWSGLRGGGEGERHPFLLLGGEERWRRKEDSEKPLLSC